MGHHRINLTLARAHVLGWRTEGKSTRSSRQRKTRWCPGRRLDRSAVGAGGKGFSKTVDAVRVIFLLRADLGRLTCARLLPSPGCAAGVRPGCSFSRALLLTFLIPHYFNFIESSATPKKANLKRKFTLKNKNQFPSSHREPQGIDTYRSLAFLYWFLKYVLMGKINGLPLGMA